MTSPSSTANRMAAEEDSEAARHAMVDALEFGNEAHGIHDWHHRADVEWVFAEKLLRHLMRYLFSPTAPDVKSGQHHLAHVLANAALLYEQARMKGFIGEVRRHGIQG